MSVMTTEKRLPDRPVWPLVTPFDTYHAVLCNVPAEPDFGLTSKTRMLRLPAVTMATLRYVAAPANSMHPKQRGIVTEASMRLAVWKDRGARMSAWDVALSFQSLYWPAGGSGRRVGRMPLRGLDLIRATDELGCEGLEWFCDVPCEDDPYAFKVVRLKYALERFAPTVESSSATSKRLASGGHR